MVDDGEVGTPATLVIALASVFLILTLAATLIAYVIYRRRYSIHTLSHVYSCLRWVILTSRVLSEKV